MLDEWKTRSLESNFNFKTDIVIFPIISAFFIIMRTRIIKSVSKTLQEKCLTDSEAGKKISVKLFGSTYRFFVYSVFMLYGCFTLFFEDWVFTPFNYTLTWNNNDIPSSIKFYYMMEMSHYATSTFFLFSEPKMADFHQMLLHHFVTLVLMSLSYYINLLRYGVAVMLIHDLADPFMELAKILFYLKYQRMADIAFTVFASVFIFTRCLVFPCLIIGPTIYYDLKMTWLWSTKICHLSLIVLFVLNIIWAVYIVRMVISFVRTGRVKGDIRDDKTADKRMK